MRERCCDNPFVGEKGTSLARLQDKREFLWREKVVLSVVGRRMKKDAVSHSPTHPISHKRRGDFRRRDVSKKDNFLAKRFTRKTPYAVQCELLWLGKFFSEIAKNQISLV